MKKILVIAFVSMFLLALLSCSKPMQINIYQPGQEIETGLTY